MFRTIRACFTFAKEGVKIVNEMLDDIANAADEINAANQYKLERKEEELVRRVKNLKALETGE